jgi:hypothetical protein
MSKHKLLPVGLFVFGGCVIAMVTISVVLMRNSAPTPNTTPDEAPIRYQAEDGLPNDEAGEKRRDYAVLEAALNDLASPKNPEDQYARALENIVVNHKTSPTGPFISRLTESVSPTSRIVPAGAQEDLARRGKLPPIWLADFKPANPNIIVDNLDGMLDQSQGYFHAGLGAIQKKYSTSSIYVWPQAPGYSTDGNSAIAVFGFPGMHGGDYTYTLSKKGKRWRVDERRVHYHE